MPVGREGVSVCVPGLVSLSLCSPPLNLDVDIDGLHTSNSNADFRIVSISKLDPTLLLETMFKYQMLCFDLGAIQTGL